MPRPVTRALSARTLPAAPTAEAAQDASLAPPTPLEAAAEDALSELPDVLLHILLRALCTAGQASPKAADEAALALVRLASCSSHLRRAVAALDDDAWLVRAHACGPAIARGFAALSSVAFDPEFALAQPLVVARGWLPTTAPVSWRAQYLSLRGKLCRDCGVVSDYCFPLLGASYRLCEKCEAADPRYALLTAAQAEESFGLSAEQLSTLPSREVRGLRSRAVEKRLRVLGQATLYLRSHVEALAAAAAEQERGLAATASNDADDSDNDSSAEADADAEADEEQFALEDDGCESTPTRRRLPPQTPEAVREAARRERKANKAAVKAANRERRQSKAAGPPAAEPRRTYAALSRSPGAAALPPRPGSSPQLPVPPGTSPQARSFGTSPQMRAMGRGGSKAAHSREAARALAAGTSPNSGGPLARAWLEDELGEFGISGLERAD